MCKSSQSPLFHLFHQASFFNSSLHPSCPVHDPFAMAGKRLLPQKEWEKRLNEVPVSKEDLNRLIMDYLVIEGYKDAAERFSTESGLSPQVDLESIENRMNIRSAIQRGDVDDAIGRVNELDPEILDTNPLLFFHLQQQRLIELIRTGDVSSALQFAAENLAPRAEEHPDLLPELERTMALLAFELPRQGAAAASAGLNTGMPPSSSGVGGKKATLEAPSYISELLAPAQRLRTAGELNAAILASQSQGREPKLPQLIKMLSFGESLLAKEGKVSFPRLDLVGALQLTEEKPAVTLTGE